MRLSTIEKLMRELRSNELSIEKKKKETDIAMTFSWIEVLALFLKLDQYDPLKKRFSAASSKIPKEKLVMLQSASNFLQTDIHTQRDILKYPFILRFKLKDILEVIGKSPHEDVRSFFHGVVLRIPSEDLDYFELRKVKVFQWDTKNIWVLSVLIERSLSNYRETIK